MWTPNDLNEVVTVFFKVWTYFGLPVYKLEITNKTEKRFQNQTSFHFLVILSMLLTSIVLFLVFFPQQNTLYNYTLLFQYFIIHGQSIGNIIYSQMKKKDLEIIFNDLLLMEEKVRQFGKIKTNYHTLGKQIMGFVMFHFFFTFMTIIFDIYYLGIGSTSFQIYISGYYFGLLSTYPFGYFLLAMPKIILKFYNDFINSINDQTTENIFKMYTELYDLAGKVFKSFQGFLLLKISTTFTIATINLFYSTYIINMDKIPFVDEVLMILDNVFLEITTLLLDFMLFYYFHMILEKKKNLSNFINDTNLYKKVDLVYLKFNLEPPSFMVYGLFPLNCSLVFSMIVGITTYVIYLIQFSPKSPF
ncbi:uncharacterized protein LOC123004092 [Tribolium madens]|uniref:uncharacterized protein LOC123004092 n=1 Tax=Tribolium madens TaxID=41895 RepID=UPI001CF730EF|nr:uncharacterized protein LOC123004092 [Tribolium madens]